MIIKKDKRTNYLRQQFLDAIERLKAKKPQNKSLRQDLANGKFKFNLANVLKESGQSKSTLYTSKYKDIRDQIADIANELKPVSPKNNDYNFSASQQTIFELKKERDANEKYAGEQIIHIQEMEVKISKHEQELERYKQQNERLEDKLEEAQAEIKRLKADRRGDSNVIQF